jgi:translation elongation factor EF-1beta
MDQLQRDVADLKADNQRLHKEITELRQIVQKLTVSGANAHENAAPPKQSEPAKGGDEEFDLFGSDDEEESDQQKKIRDDRLAAYAQKKAKKPGPIAKSTIIYDVKAWDDSTDIGEIEKHVRSIEKDGLVWGNAKVVPIAYGLKKLQICCVIEDEKVSSDLLEEEITSNEDLVQSVDVVAFNKV